MNRIKEVLEQKGIKKICLAEQLGKSYNMLHSYAQNKRQPSLETLFEISKILKVEVKALIKED
jgi:transcriptional regulator with XRE-family HTH domain